MGYCNWSMYSCNSFMFMSKMIFKDRNNFYYKFPQRSCQRCLNYPCLPNMDKLKSDFAKIGCKNFNDSNIFTWKK